MSIYNKINIAVIGATGYTGLDLVFMLSKHPKVRIKNLCASKNIGKKISFFDKRIKKKLPKISSTSNINWKILDLVFLSLPNGKAQTLIKKSVKFLNRASNNIIAFFTCTKSFKKPNPEISTQNF